MRTSRQLTYVMWEAMTVSLPKKPKGLRGTGEKIESLGFTVHRLLLKSSIFFRDTAGFAFRRSPGKWNFSQLYVAFRPKPSKITGTGVFTKGSACF